MTEALHAWRRRTEVPLMVAAMLFLAAYAWPILDPGLPEGWHRASELVMWVTWAFFAVDYLTRFLLTDDRKSFVIRHLHDLAVVLLPLLRPLRLLRLITLLSVLNQRAGNSLRGMVAVYVSGATGLLIFIASLAILDAERVNPNAEITTFGDAAWWALVSTTTVGYGDLVPTTATGRVVASGLMLAGIALLGTVTAILASWLVERVQTGQQATQSELEQLTAEVRELRVMLSAGAQETVPNDDALLRGAIEQGRPPGSTAHH